MLSVHISFWKSLFSFYVFLVWLQEGGLMKETWMEEDPRAAILRHAEAAANDPKYIAPAYAQTQPDTIFASDSDSEEN